MQPTFEPRPEGGSRGAHGLLPPSGWVPHPTSRWVSFCPERRSEARAGSPGALQPRAPVGSRWERSVPLPQVPRPEVQQLPAGPLVGAADHGAGRQQRPRAPTAPPPRGVCACPRRDPRPLVRRDPRPLLLKEPGTTGAGAGPLSPCALPRQVPQRRGIFRGRGGCAGAGPGGDLHHRLVVSLAWPRLAQRGPAGLLWGPLLPGGEARASGGQQSPVPATGEQGGLQPRSLAQTGRATRDGGGCISRRKLPVASSAGWGGQRGAGLP